MRNTPTLAQAWKEGWQAAARYTLDGTWTQNPYTTSEETKND